MLRSRFVSSSRANDIDVPATLPVLPLPRGQVLLPSNLLSLHLHRKESIAALQAALQEAEKTRKPAVIAVAPLRIKGKQSAAQTSPRRITSKPNDDDQERSEEEQRAIVDGRASRQLQPSVDSKVYVEDINEWACAGRVIRVERTTTSSSDNGETTNSLGYSIVIEGAVRVRIDRFTQVGNPYFEAAVSAFPRNSPSGQIDDKAIERLQNAGEAILEALTGSQPSNGKTPVLPSPPTSLSSVALKRLKAVLRNYSTSTADETSDILLGSLLPSTRIASYPAKLHHLSILDAQERIEHAAVHVELLKTELETREAVGSRYVTGLQKRTREMVLRGLMEAIRQELRSLRRQNQDGEHEDDDDDDDDGSPSIRIIRTGGPSFKGLPGGMGGAPGEEEEEDELAVLERKINESSMPDEVRTVVNRELKRLKSIPPMSIEHGGIRNYLDWMTDLPWGRSSYDKKAITEDGEEEVQGQLQIIDKQFLERARKRLNDDHYGIDKVKERLLQYLAVLRMRLEKDEVVRKAWEVKEDERIREEEERVEKEREERMIIDAEGNILDDGSEGPQSKALVRRNKKIPPPLKLGSPRGGRRPNSPQQPPTPVEPEKPKRRAPPPGSKDRGPILLLVGPPGTGKTSIARSLASALDRPYHRISLGGVRDEAEIRGHRRTYVGSMPGVIIQALRKVGVNNPVFLLDEIDKLTSGASFHGDPSAAMLEVLDPEQNFSFNDHYINTPVDLSSVLFIATANDLSTIPPALLDRMEVIHLSGYVYDEKIQIARKYLLPKQIKANMLQPGHVEVSDEVLMEVIAKYTGEAGVRTLERQVGALCRWKAVELATARDKLPQGDRPPLETVEIDGYSPIVRKEDLESILGVSHQGDDLDMDEEARERKPGVATGLAYLGSGNGDTLHVEVTSMPGKGGLRLTGSLGEVISESGQLALSWVKSNAYELGLTQTRKEDVMKDIDLHLHLPSGSIKKDGPSAGVCMVMAIVSLLSGHVVDPKLAMTGEITLRGSVTPVGGIKEKVLAAHRVGIKHVLLPHRNRKDAEADLPKSVQEELKITYVKNIWQALEVVFGDKVGGHPGEMLSLGRPGEDGKERRETVERVLKL